VWGGRGVVGLSFYAYSFSPRGRIREKKVRNGSCLKERRGKTHVRRIKKVVGREEKTSK